MTTDLMNNCRTCMKGSDDLTNVNSIVKIEDETLELREQLEKCTSLTIYPNENLPQNICKDCVRQLNNAFRFRKKCLEIDNILRWQMGIKMEQNESCEFTSNEHNESGNFEIDLSSVYTIKNEVSETEGCSSSKATNIVEILDSDDENRATTCAVTETAGAYVKCILNEDDGAKTPESSDFSDFGDDVDVMVKPQPQFGEIISTSEDNDDYKDGDWTIRNSGLNQNPLSVSNSAVMRRNNLKPKKIIPCSMCSKTFTKASSYHQHLRLHDPHNPNKCDICFRICVSKTALSNHRATHTGEKPFSCEVCGLRAITKYHIDVHMRKHTGERPFECPICDKRFSTASHKIYHMRCHKQERLFQCSTCLKQFFTSSHLKYHLEQTICEVNSQVK